MLKDSASKEYKCVCGKIFDNPQKFNGHKSNCKVHILNKYGRLDVFDENRKVAAKKTSAKLKQLCAEKAQAKLNHWINEQHTCETCGKLLTEKYGSGRFCSAQCARSFSTISKRDEINAKLKIANDLNHRYKIAQCSICKVDVHVGISAKTQDYICPKCIKNVSNDNQEIRCKLRAQLAEEYKLADSPYNEFDTLYLNYDFRNDPYLYLVKHDGNGKEIARYKVYLYRYNIELELHRKLNSNEVIHHIDGNHFNNDRSNLIVLLNSIHSKLHAKTLTLDDIIANHLYVYR